MSTRDDRIRTFVDRGMTIREMADLLGEGPEKVRSTIRRLGLLTLRSRNEGFSEIPTINHGLLDRLANGEEPDEAEARAGSSEIADAARILRERHLQRKRGRNDCPRQHNREVSP